MPLVDAPAKSGRSKGRQAPTIPSDDSTIGQYTVGVSRSAHSSSVWHGRSESLEFVHVTSTA